MPHEHTQPPFENVRMATLTDVPRIASIATAGFFWSPVFQFQRPFYADFPEDTISSYWDDYRDMIMDPSTVVLVAEDAVDADEAEKVYEALRQCPLHRPGRPPQVKVVVGVCTISLRPGSALIGQFQNDEKGSYVESLEVRALLSELSRDQSAEAIKEYENATAQAKTRYLAGKMRLSTLTVHPAYWGRGHATRLVSWCTRLADMEGVAIGISAAPMGATLAAHAGFEERELLRVKSRASPDRPSVSDVVLWIGIRPPSRSPSDTNTGSSDSPSSDAEALVAHTKVV